VRGTRRRKMSAQPEIHMVKADVTVQELDEECEECTVGPPTHVVMLDIRSLGETHALGRYCQKCAESIADRVRDGLPR
jgi:hypothetical protein